ncbi:UvrD-helicase domain-containing protein [Flavobacterium sp. MAH-1]|uniref:DNA 3'-5' helicase II n=1 Tax=Flavobacterium agri TaxID=2743471 RepID=A0A7Y9C6K9_9FLAO|nr:UvrD-helicase domain-containing protein [Flavobacterium agri]NUY82472.1 UvrD-helicase domain-containing protein [Flavobacterium agri]NYA72496.1 UvrD-helicase domain-containing protein [Flavobacterium agri]
MNNRIFPTWEQIKEFKQPLTDGELYLLNYLNQNLERDQDFQSGNDLANYNGWLIFVQPFLNGSRPDIIIFNPKVGVQIIEVKDWNLNYYSFERDEKSNKWNFTVSDSKGTYPIKSPIKQVEYYKEKLLGQLIPQLGEEIDKDKNRYGLVKTSVYFHNSTTEKAQELFKQEYINYTSFPVFGRNSLLASNIKQIVPDSYLRQSYYWVKDCNKEILFWLNPPFHSIEQGIKLNLNTYQKKFAEPEPGHHRVRGVAGSGKTQVLAHRAGNLASQGYRVLILSFNITLWHYIRDMVQRSPYAFSWKQFTFGHFHGFCKDVLNEFGEKWPNETAGTEIIFRDIVPNKVIEVIGKGDFVKYDAILIDEGQDYYVEWYNMLCKFLTERDEVVVVCDKKQNIYSREMDWLDKRRAGVEKFGEWTELKTIVRLPERIAAMTREFSEKYNLNQDVRVENIERPDLFNQYQEHSIWWNIDEMQWLAKIDEAFEIIKQNATSKHGSDTVILLPDKNYGYECVKHFEVIKNMKVNHVFENQSEKKYHKHKKAFWMGDSRLKISTIHSFKGWEVLNVILFIPEKYFGGDEAVDKIVYTAMTRTRQNLIVINSNKKYNEFGSGLSKVWQ